MHELLAFWVSEARKGDQESFARVVRSMQQPVFRYCYPMLGNREDAEDVVQEVFIRAYEHLDSYEEKGQFTGWLFTIAHRLCLNKIKYRSRWFAVINKAAEQERNATTNIELDVHEDETLILLNCLKPALKSVVILKVLNGMSYEEISAVTGVKAQSLRKQFERARKQLKKEYANRRAQMKGEVHFEF
ncbi:hypothetical protein DNH61_07415 [Paenibacillus sambharensis]|uniref:RNA polymerase sigma factor n=1 Tax=Paenibacillus sambharensis TaxID=1803190 RepID=A0A2W1LQ16_9BACL|nr:sigma-70 family RNA polymerase sigma factor [Paenibacillus sambharensis]PZD96614.1 hypothetical protein DNH61_07415 [Paenibacillus sambharensis]